MHDRSSRLLVGGLLLCLGATLSASTPSLSQQPPQGSGRQSDNGRSYRRPGGDRPGGGSSNSGRPQPQPARPQPGNRPGPGGGSNAGNRPGAGASRPRPGTRPPSRPGNRPPQWGRPPQNRPSYNFRPNDRAYLRRYYQSHFGYINRSRRPIFSIGGYFPYGDIGYLTPVPSNLYGYLPPPPPGYQVGYFDGYVVVYDPITFFIANVLDLLQ